MWDGIRRQGGSSRQFDQRVFGGQLLADSKRSFADFRAYYAFHFRIERRFAGGSHNDIITKSKPSEWAPLSSALRIRGAGGTGVC
jgi:hypothetical protein